jgi:hypothetical protein
MTALPWLEVCGTDRGYQRHRYWGSPPCFPCSEAHRLYEKQRRDAAPQRPPRELVPCGTASAWRRHVRRGEIACDSCVQAHRVDVAQYAARKRRAA